ncbi:hypothetical protein Tco_0621654 [Tanacetum coccineum]
MDKWAVIGNGDNVTMAVMKGIMEMVRMEMVEMEIQMRMVEVIDLLLGELHISGLHQVSTTYFKGKMELSGLIMVVLKKMEEVHISNCPEKSQVKYATCTLLNRDFQEVGLCVHQVVPEEGRIGFEKFVGGLPDNIKGNVIAAEPTRLQDAVRIANNLMDQNLKGYAVKNAENKRRLEVNCS